MRCHVLRKLSSVAEKHHDQTMTMTTMMTMTELRPNSETPSAIEGVLGPIV